MQCSVLWMRQKLYCAKCSADAATIISVALQYGVPVAALDKSVGRAPDLSTTPGSIDQLNASSQPASPIGAALDLLMAHEPRPNGAPADG